MLKLILSFFTVTALALPVWAEDGLIGLFKDLQTGNSITVTVKARDLARIDWSADAAYMLIDGGGVWRLQPGGRGWYLSDYGEALQRFADADDPRLPHADAVYRDTGQTETIGGYTGAVFAITDRRAHVTYEAVLCNDAELFKVSQALMYMYGNINAPLGQRSAVDKIIAETGVNYGVLRLGNLFEFEALENRNVAEGCWDLPENIIF